MVIELTESFEVLDPRFRKLAFPNVHVEELWTGCRWAEGPAWFAAGRYLVWSDIPNDRMLRWDETDGSVSVFRQPAMNTNGHTVDLQGRLVSCEHRGRCVSRTEHDGTRTVLAAQFDGKRFNSPNDVIVKSDASLWFTDPSYGIDSDYEGDAAPGEIGASRVYRIDGASGAISVVAGDFVQPNGLAFSPDESLLYIVDTGATHQADGPHHVRRFKVGTNGTLSGGEVFATCPVGLYDGLRVDVHGNLWLSAGDGVHCHAPDGTLLGKILIPETVANVCFGGAKLNRLFICGTTSLYAVYLNTRGARPRAA
ncbi:SMP-30/gluconolactonase/LRE family protein [Rhizobacter sp. AJA081-3]|uniref:SMP-30/gluconolactonase/LRE family protein n=1 Tax=Rhizobacter sp. AJA081-3 TaxID=2753607 RepID=UPI001ADF09D8|nr:SMP-30/gluconolactonase/LRE family protein [Rhizobacter sp. AJA081-3]QTN22272.1 SMP-30/gluconolactonase/LRE family protein [Rhizobacter sp. AJA081-3]